MILSSSVNMLIADLRDNLAQQDEINRMVIRHRTFDRHHLAQKAIEELTQVMGRQGVIVAQLKMKGVDENEIRDILFAR